MSRRSGNLATSPALFGLVILGALVVGGFVFVQTDNLAFALVVGFAILVLGWMYALGKLLEIIAWMWEKTCDLLKVLIRNVAEVIKSQHRLQMQQSADHRRIEIARIQQQGRVLLQRTSGDNLTARKVAEAHVRLSKQEARRLARLPTPRQIDLDPRLDYDFVDGEGADEREWR